MDDPELMDDEEITEERVLELGNKVLEVLGAEDKITEIEHFCMDSLYLQLFQALFPQFNFEDIEPGQNEEEMAENIDQLIKLLETNILEHDLSDIKAEAIVGGNLAHIDEFLQVLLQVVFLMIQNQAEGEESEEEMESAQKQKSSSKKKGQSDSKRVDSDRHSDDGDNKDETDTQKMAKDMGLHSPDEDGEKDIHDIDFMGEDMNEKERHLLQELEHEYEEQLGKDSFHEGAGSGPHSRKKSGKEVDEDDPRFSNLNFYGQNPPDHKQVMVDDDNEDEEALMMRQARKKAEGKDASDAKKKQPDSKPKEKEAAKKHEVDVLNDPLLPEGVDFGHKKKNRDRAGSLGGGSFKGNDILDEGDDDDDLLYIENLDELDEEQKYMVLQHLFEEYQKNPDAFPEEQKELLEREMMKLYQQAEMEGELDEEDYDDNMMQDMHPHSSDKRYNSSGKKKQWMDDDSDDGHDMLMADSAQKAKPRPLKDEDSHHQSDQEEEDERNRHHDDEEDEDEKYMKEILTQQNNAKAEREEQIQQMEHNEEEEDHDEGEHDQDDDHAPQAFQITEEEFNNLSPEQQQQMLMMMQQQQLAEQEAEGEEGEGEDQVPEVDENYLNALHQQQMMQQAQLNQMRRMKPKKAKKAKKKRPSTAKYGWNTRSQRLQSRSLMRPGTAKRRKTKTKSKAKKRRLQEQQMLQQYQQQQMLQQLALQQQLQAQHEDGMDEEQAALLQQNLANIQPVDEDGNPVELTPEELAQFQQNILQQHQLNAAEGEGEGDTMDQYTPEQIAMLQQQAMQQQMYQNQMRKKKVKRRASSKRRASRKKSKTRKPKRKQYVDEQTAFMMMLQNNPELQQQFLQQQQMQAMEQQQMQQEMYNVDKIDEEENEESPMKQPTGADHERPTEESNVEELMRQQQLQGDDTGDGIYEEDDENQQMLNNLTPEQLAYLQQKAQEQQMHEMQQYQSPDQGNYRNIYDAQNDVQRNIINQNEALNNMFKKYISDMRKNEIKKAKRRLKKQQKSRRRSFAVYGSRGGTQNMVSYKRGLDLKSKIKRDVKQVMLAKKIYMLANEIERNRLLEEKRRMAELRKTNKSRKKSLKNTMRNRFQDQMALLKQSIESERMDRKIAKFVRTQAMQQWKRDLSRKQPQIQLPMGSYA